MEKVSLNDLSPEGNSPQGSEEVSENEREYKDQVFESEEEFINDIGGDERNEYLNVSKVEEGGVKVVKAKKILRFYKRFFPGSEKPSPRVDVLVEVMNGDLKGQEFVLTLNKKSFKKLREKFGSLSENLSGKLLSISVDNSGKVKFLVVDEYVQI